MPASLVKHNRKSHHPILYEMNVRVQLSELALEVGRSVTLDDIPEQELDRFKALGFDYIWLVGTWRTGELSRTVARNYEGLQSVYKQAVQNFSPDDVLGSPYAIAEYAVDSLVGGSNAAQRFRNKLAERGMGLILDFVANHTGLDHRWIYEHPDYYIQGTPEDLARAPHDFFQANTCMGPKIIAHGRDPYFPPWTDTAQLNLTSEIVQQELVIELLNIADQCDGVRCDMAMLAFPSIIRQTWGDRPLLSLSGRLADHELWDVVIKAARGKNPAFLFIAEAYWGSEARLQELGFDYIYDKTFHDRVVHKTGHELFAHLRADPNWQAKTVRFLENHDEDRSAQTLPFDRHIAALVLAATVPGMLLLHDGQLEGRKVKLPIQLRRRYNEPADKIIRFFYEKLLHAVKEHNIRDGLWELLKIGPAWEGNPTWLDYIAYLCIDPSGQAKLVIINYGDTQGQCYVFLPKEQLLGSQVVLKDILGVERYVRNSDEIIHKGIYFDMPAYGSNIFMLDVPC